MNSNHNHEFVKPQHQVAHNDLVNNDWGRGAKSPVATAERKKQLEYWFTPNTYYNFHLPRVAYPFHPAEYVNPEDPRESLWARLNAAHRDMVTNDWGRVKQLTRGRQLDFWRCEAVKYYGADGLREFDARFPRHPKAPKPLAAPVLAGTVYTAKLGVTDLDLPAGLELNPEHPLVKGLTAEVERVDEVPAEDPVNHPAHYTGDPSGVECIDVTRHRTFNVGNAIKYLWRAGLKQDVGRDSIDKQIEDLRKAAWYAEDEAKRLERERDAQ